MATKSMLASQTVSRFPYLLGSSFAFSAYKSLWQVLLKVLRILPKVIATARLEHGLVWLDPRPFCDVLGRRFQLDPCIDDQQGH